MGVSHSVFLSFKEGAPEQAIQEFWDKLDEFPGKKPGLRHWISGKPGNYYPISSDHYDLAFSVEVDSPAAMIDYAQHPFHMEAAALMGPIVEDVLVLDFEFTSIQQSAVTYRPPREGDDDVAIAHVTMLAFNDDASDKDIEEFTLALDRFPRQKPFIRRWILGKPGPYYGSATDRFDLAFIAEVDSIEAMEAYAGHPYHTEVVGPMLGPIMKDVLVVDFAFSRVIESAVDYAQIIPYR
ncbi:MAG TPA: hypothetical protein DGL25_06030 [Dehalococcoidia bacterium]|nr:hypothetical protein [Dehalococcoidia bacterium]